MVVPAFLQPVLHAQSTFRAILDAFARPGRVQKLPEIVAAPVPLSAGAAAVALTLCDHDTPVWLDDKLSQNREVGEWLRFHCGCQIVAEPSGAGFAFAADPAAISPFDAFNLGTPDYPDRSTTVVLQVESLKTGTELTLVGPGIRNRVSLCAEPLPSDIANRLVRNRMLFPRGIDLLLVAESEVLGLPRSVRIVET